MQFLFEEFFGKAFKFINAINIFVIRFLIKLIFSFVILFFIGLIIWLVFSGRTIIVLIILGAYILAEVAHYLRKSREKVMQKNITEINAMKNQSKNQNLLKHKKKGLLKKRLVVVKPKTMSKQKTIGESTKKGLINLEEPKNESLLKPKNKKLLRKGK